MEKTLWQGFLFTVRRTHYFYESDTTKRTDKVCRAFIERVGTDFCKGREEIERAKANKDELDAFRRVIDPVTLTKHALPDGTPYFCLVGKGFSLSYPVDDFCETFVVF